jgi:hypothetical protein
MALALGVLLVFILARLSKAQVAAVAASAAEVDVVKQGPASCRDGMKSYLYAKGGILTLTSSQVTFVAHGFAQKAERQTWPLEDLTGAEHAWTGISPSSLRLRFKDRSIIVAVRDRQDWEDALARAKEGQGALRGGYLASDRPLRFGRRGLMPSRSVQHKGNPHVRTDRRPLRLA